MSTAKVEGRAPFLTKSDYAYKELRRRIIEGELAAGTRILLRPMAEQLGLSVMPVRDAIRLLERDGLVTTESHRGATVTTISREDVIESLSIRMWLQILAVREATPLHNEQSLAAAALALREAGRKAARGGLAYSEANRALHEALEAPASPAIRQIIGDLWDRFWQTRRSMSLFVLAPERIPGAEHEHGELFEAISDGDGDAAAAVMARHRESSLQAWEQVLQSGREEPG